VDSSIPPAELKKDVGKLGKELGFDGVQDGAVSHHLLLSEHGITHGLNRVSGSHDNEQA
jgi:hypothetical protein